MTLSTSDNLKYLRHLVGHLFVAIFCALFGAIYELFGHKIYSYYMIYAFAIPLVCGASVYAVLALWGKKEPNIRAMRLWNSAIATFTIGSLFRGVLHIYGTTNRLIIVYPVVGIMLVAATVICLIRSGRKNVSD